MHITDYDNNILSLYEKALTTFDDHVTD